MMDNFLEKSLIQILSSRNTLCQRIKNSFKNRKILDEVRDVMRLHHYSIHTERTYCDWIKRYIQYHNMTSRQDLIDGEARIEAFLTHLAVDKAVAPSTQNQALNAIVFLYGQALDVYAGEFGDFVRAKRSKRVPVVLTRSEVHKILGGLSGVYYLMAGLLYGGGLRLMECVRLRVKDVDFERLQITVRDGKGKKDRITMLPERFVPPLQEQLAYAKDLYEKDLEGGLAGVSIWPGLDRIWEIEIN